MCPLRGLGLIEDRVLDVLRFHWDKGQANHLPFKAASFNLVTAIGLTEYWPADYLQSLLHAVKRILSPQGRLIIDFIDWTQSSAKDSRQFEAIRGLDLFAHAYADIDHLIAVSGLKATRNLSTDRRIIYRVQAAV